MPASTKERVLILCMNAELSPRGLPLGAAVVAAAISDQIAVSLLTITPADQLSHVAQKILDYGPWMVGFSLYVWNHEILAVLALELRKAAPQIRLLAGGPEASANPARLAAAGLFDAVIAGEGEHAARTLVADWLSGTNRPEIAGVWYPDLAPQQARARPATFDVGTSAYLGGTLDPADYGGALWELTRGCPYRCTYCFESRGDHRLRSKPLELVLAELEVFRKRGAWQIFVLDPTFNSDRQRAKELLSILVNQAAEFHYDFEVRAELLDAEQAALFGELDCSLQIGLQSADPAVLAKVGRTLEPGRFRSQLRLLDRAGVAFGLDLIYGLPGDTLQGFRNSLAYALSCRPNHLDMFCLAVLPGTQLALDAAGFGLEWQVEAPYLVQSTPQFPADDLARAALLALVVDYLYNRGRAVSWFQAILDYLHLTVLELVDMALDWYERQPAKVREKLARLDADGHPDGAAILAMQQAVFQAAFAGSDRLQAWPAAADLLAYHAAWNQAALEGKRQTLRLRYAADELDEAACLDFGRWFSRAKPVANTVQIGPDPRGGVKVKRQRV